jgi:hypothetical protein
MRGRGGMHDREDAVCTMDELLQTGGRLVLGHQISLLRSAGVVMSREVRSSCWNVWPKLGMGRQRRMPPSVRAIRAACVTRSAARKSGRGADAPQGGGSGPGMIVSASTDHCHKNWRTRSDQAYADACASCDDAGGLAWQRTLGKPPHVAPLLVSRR